MDWGSHDTSKEMHTFVFRTSPRKTCINSFFVKINTFCRWNGNQLLPSVTLVWFATNICSFHSNKTAPRHRSAFQHRQPRTLALHKLTKVKRNSFQTMDGVYALLVLANRPRYHRSKRRHCMTGCIPQGGRGWGGGGAGGVGGSSKDYGTQRCYVSMTRADVYPSSKTYMSCFRRPKTCASYKR